MSLFGRKIEDKKKATVKSAPVKDAKKAETVKIETQSMKDLYSAAAPVKARGAKVKDGKKPEVRTVYGNAYKVLVKPLVTEKVSNLAVLNKYVFAVARSANKIEVAKAIKEIYGIKPIGVNIMNRLGKKARYGRVSGRRKDWKKAIITLPKGETIKIYEGV